MVSTAKFRRQRVKRRQSLLIKLAPLAAALWTIGIFIWAQSFMIKQPSSPKNSTPETNMKKVPAAHFDPGHQYELWPDDYSSTEFFSTLKSCMPSDKKKCLEYIPDGTDEQRIALLRPPGSLGYLFTRFVEEVVRLHANNSTKLVLLPTSSVPPYGYGKTHGYTKIIRFAALPLELSAADILISTEATDFKVHNQEGAFSVIDLKQIVRQLVRWHCRLSHVAAHTSLMTVTLESIAEEPWDVEYNIRVFLGLGSDVNSVDHALQEKHVDEDEIYESIDQVIHHASMLLSEAEKTVSEFPDSILHSVIDDELIRSHNLTDWPCLSFWSVGDDPKRTELTPVARRMAKSFSPNCTDSHSRCFVQRDKCEARGDALCKK